MVLKPIIHSLLSPIQPSKMETPLQNAAIKNTGLAPVLSQRASFLEWVGCENFSPCLQLKLSSSQVKLRRKDSLFPSAPICGMEVLSWMQHCWEYWDPLILAQAYKAEVPCGERVADKTWGYFPPTPNTQLLKWGCHHCSHPQLQSHSSEISFRRRNRLQNRELWISSQRNRLHFQQSVKSSGLGHSLK